jgi:alkanesulfonate monooxygenase SsuD/methylene tetrahydromethanopterin reductase-like flavin-dependent oxidoreductase (luciferase family)
VVIQAGSSGPGQDLAAATADLVFTAQESKTSAQAFYSSVKGRAAAIGRSPEELIVMPGVFAIVGETEGEAQAKFAALQDLIEPAVGISFLANLLGDVDLASIDVDQPFPTLSDTNASKSRLEMIRRMGLEEHYTIREAYTRLAPARGHLTLIGSAEHVADTLCDWHADGAADGFMLVPGLMPQAQTDFDRLVLPIL